MPIHASQPEVRLPQPTPRQQAANKASWNASRPDADADFFTVGYAGRTGDEVAQILLQAGVRTLVDIRFNPVSMYRPDFGRTKLQHDMSLHQVGYVHAPQLGVPREVRLQAAHEQNVEQIWSWYDEHVASRFFEYNLDHFFNALEHPAAFMCVEVDPTSCHRHRLALQLERLGLRSHDL
jgi:uncharacterized protein (DUF488 family)